MRWVSPCQGSPASTALSARDGRRLRLGPGEEAGLSFPVPNDLGSQSEYRVALRLFGYYDFLPSTREQRTLGAR
jgi:hypothetical protein